MVKPRILILGATGQLGRELQRSFADAGEQIACGRNSVDLANAKQIQDVVRRAAPDVILNAAAYTAVDRAETEPELATAINAVAPCVLAAEAQRAGALLVHYSTDYVFDGSKTAPWSETDTTHPLNIYGQTKLAGEQAIQQVGGKFLIFRTSWVYGPHGHNFLLTMLRLARERNQIKVVDDQYGAPTSSMELANATHSVVGQILAGQFESASQWVGLYHMTCSGSTSWCGFAREIFHQSGRILEGRTPEVLPISSAEYPTPARRPTNSVLSSEKLMSTFGVRLAGWQAALQQVVTHLSA